MAARSFSSPFSLFSTLSRQVPDSAGVTAPAGVVCVVIAPGTDAATSPIASTTNRSSSIRASSV